MEACEGHSETSSSPQEEDVLEQPCGLDMLLRGKEQDQKTQITSLGDQNHRLIT